MSDEFWIAQERKDALRRAEKDGRIADSHDAKQELVTRCDEAHAAMQKGEADGQ